jgi:hypothetical protein
MTEQHVDDGAPSLGDDDLQEQIDMLRAQVTANRSDIDDLQASGQLDHALLEALQEKGVSQVELAQNLRRALESSRRIGAAVGIVMAQRLITEEAAFELLRTLSQNRNMKLRDVADRVVETGVIPDAARE